MVSGEQTPIMLCCSIGGNDTPGDIADDDHLIDSVTGSGGVLIEMMIEVFIEALIDGTDVVDHFKIEPPTQFDPEPNDLSGITYHFEPVVGGLG